jgi:hypothetical protein
LRQVDTAGILRLEPLTGGQCSTDADLAVLRGGALRRQRTHKMIFRTPTQPQQRMTIADIVGEPLLVRKLYGFACA